MSAKKLRCQWVKESDPLEIAYHDLEWGVPVHDDKKHFEFLILDTFQAGLSWNTILNKRGNFRNAFDQFDVNKVAKYGEVEYERLINDAGIIRNKLKVRSAISNAKLFIQVQQEFGSFDAYIWAFSKGKTIKNKFKSIAEVPATSTLSDSISKDMKKRGFKFVGSTIIYAYLQAVGIVNDHTTDCFRYEENY